MRLGPAALLILLLAPASAAAPSSGRFLVEGDVALPASSVLDAHAPLLFWRDASPRLAWDVTAAEVHVERFEERTYTVAGSTVSGGKTVQSFTLTDARVTLEGARGWVGVYGGTSGFTATLDAATDASAVLRAEEKGRVGNAEASTAGSDEGIRAFWQDFGRAFTSCACRGDLRVEGTFVAKVHGPEVRIDARENATTHETGARPASAVESVHRWLVLTFRGASGAIHSPAPLLLAADQIAAAVEGTLAFQPRSGELRVEGAPVDHRGRETRLTGTFDLAARAQDAQRQPLLDLALEGDLTATNLAGAPVASGPVGPVRALPLALAIVLLATAGAAAGGVAVRRVSRRARQERLSAEECLDLASRAAEEGRFGAALDWTRRALALAPRHAQLKTDEGWYLSRLGDVDGALAAYAEAAALADDGQADYLAAALLVDTGAPPEAAAPHLLRALARTPSLALEAEDEEAFHALRTRPDVARALEEALRKVD